MAIDLEKKELRRQLKESRKKLPVQLKNDNDREITVRLLSLKQYSEAGLILTYVSNSFEIDTREFISAALVNGKRVACPRCIDDNGNMNFYFINSPDALKTGCFGILEPDENCALCEEYDNSICVVPGLGFDMSGYRLGYGKGYYDRFLQNYQGISIGISYSSCVKLKFPRDNHDRHVDIIVTEKYHRIIR